MGPRLVYSDVSLTAVMEDQDLGPHPHPWLADCNSVKLSTPCLSHIGMRRYNNLFEINADFQTQMFISNLVVAFDIHHSLKIQSYIQHNFHMNFLDFTVFVVVQLLNCVWLFVTLWTAACQVSLSFTISRSLPKLMSIESVMPSNNLILCHPLLLLPSIFSSIWVFSSESVLRIRWPRYWSFSFSISSSNEYAGLISFRIDSFDRLAAQGILKSLLQHHSSIASILCCSAFFMVQLSEMYMTTEKTTALTIHTFCQWSDGSAC